jgi:hypothetical protein
MLVGVACLDDLDRIECVDLAEDVEVGDGPVG